MHTILLIEDNEAIRENTSELLELEGYTVLSAVNGRDGLQMVREFKPDLIFCDIMMPEADGYEVLKELKKHHETSKIPFIFLTASVEKKDVETGLGMGADGYIRKPFEPQELFDAVAHFLKKQ